MTVRAEIPESHPSAAVLGTRRFGSGAVIDDDGHVLTANYIVLGASEVYVTDVAGNEYPAMPVAQDFLTGTAIVGMPPEELPALSPGSSRSVSLGDDVFIVASVGEADRRSGSGFVTSLDPFDAYWEYYLERGIWVSAINPGLGGAPLCDTRGRLIGIVSLNLGAIGRATLAIPAEHYFDHAAELLEHGRRVSRPPRPWLGMFCYTLPDRTVVAGLIPGSPAEIGGLQAGDVIVRIDDEQVTERLQLYRALWERRPGEPVGLQVYRNDQLEEIVILTGDAEEFFAGDSD